MIAVMTLLGVDQIVVRQGIHGSVELGNGVQIHTLEDRDASRRESLGSIRKDRDDASLNSSATGGGGFFDRWRKMDIDAGDNVGGANETSKTNNL